ncbi:MAG: YicC/YloC family endoribonuclease [Aestuariivirga sp.]
MPLSSMTGFARIAGSYGECRWHWEMRSVNGKNLDVRCRLPSGFEAVEAPVKAAAAARFKRGNLQAALDVPEAPAGGRAVINEVLLEQLAEAAARLSRKHGGGALQVEQLLNVRGVVEIASADEEDSEIASRDAAIVASFEACADQLLAGRREEGKRLLEVLRGQVDRIEALATAARDNPNRAPDAIRKRLADQIAKLTGTEAGLDPARLHQEALLIAVKADIQEELDRLFSHVGAARELLASDEAVGRKFEFLAQEFNREANTLCSKAADPSLTAIGLELKSVIDQLREQALNIE